MDMKKEHADAIKQAIKDLESRIDERIENLCAIYGTPNIAPMLGTLITIESAFSAQTKLIMLVAEDERTAKSAAEALQHLQPSALAKISRNLMEMSDIPEDRRKQLMLDMIGVLKVRRQCEDEIENVLNQVGDEDEK
jgi:hypothetical protein